jgi:predicted nucleotidyltransferase
MSPPVSDFLDRVTDWSAHQPTIAAVALVGSHARSEARPDSDIDVVLRGTTGILGTYLLDTPLWRSGEVSHGRMGIGDIAPGVLHRGT